MKSQFTAGGYAMERWLEEAGPRRRKYIQDGRKKRIEHLFGERSSELETCGATAAGSPIYERAALDIAWQAAMQAFDTERKDGSGPPLDKEIAEVTVASSSRYATCNFCGMPVAKGGALKRHVEEVHQMPYSMYARSRLPSTSS